MEIRTGFRPYVFDGLPGRSTMDTIRLLNAAHLRYLDRRAMVVVSLLHPVHNRSRHGEKGSTKEVDTKSTDSGGTGEGHLWS